MPRSLMERMTGIGRAVSDRLDKIPSYMGERSQSATPRPQLELPDYLLQAQTYAAQDPQFAARLTLSIQQYTAATNVARALQEQAHGK